MHNRWRTPPANITSPLHDPSHPSQVSHKFSRAKSSQSNKNDVKRRFIIFSLLFDGLETVMSSNLTNMIRFIIANTVYPAEYIYCFGIINTFSLFSGKSF